MNDDMVPELDDLWWEANEYVNHGDFDKAVEIYRYILIRYVDNSLANENANAHLGDVLLMLGQTDLAEGHIRNASAIIHRTHATTACWVSSITHGMNGRMLFRSTNWRLTGSRGIGSTCMPWDELTQKGR